MEIGEPDPAQQCEYCMLANIWVVGGSQKVLEALLAETARHFERRHVRLRLLAESMEEEVGHSLGVDSSDLQRLLPIQRYKPQNPHDSSCT